MALKLRVTTYGGRLMGAAAEHVFDESGGSIGRAQVNDWCLPDPERLVSGSHATICCRDGDFYLRDTSTNGTFLNAQPLAKGDEKPLRDGDCLKIGMYEIAVEETDSLRGSAKNAQDRQQPSFRDIPAELDVDPGATLDPLELFGGGTGPRGPARSRDDPGFGSHGAQPDHAGPEAMGFKPPGARPDPDPMPAPAARPGEIPENWDLTGFTNDLPPPVSPAPRSAAPPRPGPEASASPPLRATAPASDPDDGIAALLQAAGIRPELVDADIYPILGCILEVVIKGTVEVLRSRAQIKDQFRVPATMLKPVENNPLKFSINAQDALQNLFAKKNTGYQSPVEAFEESFEDIKAHQVAMIAGMRAAYRAMFDTFNPAELEAEFDRELKRGVLGGVMGKSRYWDLYIERYGLLSRDQDSSFHDLFGDEFARAYEEQMQRLSAIRKR